jgi:hypothetical protein
VTEFEQVEIFLVEDLNKTRLSSSANSAEEKGAMEANERRF